jgi:hypothetical protein
VRKRLAEDQWLARVKRAWTPQRPGPLAFKAKLICLRQSSFRGELPVVIDDCEGLGVVTTLEMEGLVVRTVDINHLAWI